MLYLYYNIHIPGVHKIVMKYADVEVLGSPFKVSAFDITKIKTSKIENGIVGIPVTFEGEFFSQTKST